jgi:predicted small lipoprotein YifL
MRKAVKIFTTIFIILTIAFSLSGCGEKKVEEIYGIDFNAPDYARIVSKPIKDFSKEIATWTPTSREAAERLDANDLEGALEILFREMVETDSMQEDGFIFSAMGPDWEILFSDPKLVFDLYRDRDRSGWPEDEKAAADLMVALTYERGEIAGAVAEDPNQGEGVNTDKVRYELQLLAVEEYQNIAYEFPNSKVAILAKLALALYYVGGEDGAEKNSIILQEIEQSYPDSVYATRARMLLATAYHALINHYLPVSEAEKIRTAYRSALLEYDEVLKMPDYFVSSSFPGCDSAHAIAESAIEEIKNTLGE